MIVSDAQQRGGTTYRRATERTGAQFEGILRSHVVMPDGTYRVIDSEWPAMKRHPTLMMAGGEE